MSNIILKNRYGEEVQYSNVTSVGMRIGDDEYTTFIKPPEPKQVVVTPSKEEKVITSNVAAGTYYNKVTVKAIPEKYIEPTGDLDITENGEYDVSAYKNAKINVQGGSNIMIDETLTKDGYAADAGAVGDKFERIEGLIKQAALYKAIEVTAVSVSPDKIEIGGSSSVKVTWATSKTPKTIKIKVKKPSGTSEVTVSDTSKTSETFTGINAQTTFEVVVTDEMDSTASKSATTYIYSGVYYGVAAEPSSYTSSFVLGLNVALQANRKKSFTVNAGSGQYIYYCVPTSYGECGFSIDGWGGGFEKPKTIEVTNASGYKQNYYIYRSTNASLGSSSVVVS